MNAADHWTGLTVQKGEFKIDLRRPAEARQSADKVWDGMWDKVSARRQKLFPNKPLGLDDGDPYGSRTAGTGPFAVRQLLGSRFGKVVVRSRDPASGNFRPTNRLFACDLRTP